MSAQHLAGRRGWPFYIVGAGLPNLPRALTEVRSYAERLLNYRPSTEAARALVEPAERLDASYFPGVVPERQPAERQDVLRQGGRPQRREEERHLRANEPNGVSWDQIRTYANQVIPIIRAADPDAVTIVGTRGWSSLGVSNGSSSAEIVANPIAFSNIMYTFHFYAASHYDSYRNEVRNAASKLPIFVTEFGTTSATGGGTVDIASSTTWLDLLDSLKISYVNWTYSDADESSATF